MGHLLKCSTRYSGNEFNFVNIVFLKLWDQGYKIKPLFWGKNVFYFSKTQQTHAKVR